MKLDKTQATIILCSVYLFFSLVANIASTKLISIAGMVTDAGILYYFIFTWRDLLHKQLGKKAAITMIWVAAALNLAAALFFQLVVALPGEATWAAAGGQTAWEFIFSLQFRLVIASIIAFVFSELVDTFVYEWWVKKHKGNEWSRVVISNAVSMPVDTILFTVIAFSGVVSNPILWQIFYTNTILKILATALSFWMIYLVPEKKIYTD